MDRTADMAEAEGGEKVQEKEMGGGEEEDLQTQPELDADRLFEWFYMPSPHQQRKHILRATDTAALPTNAQNALGWTLLHGDLELVLRLLNKGADPNAADTTGNTPLHWAIQHRQEELVRVLIEHGADPHKKNILAVSPIALAPENNRRHIAELRKAFQSKHSILPAKDLDSEWFAVQARRIARIMKAFLANQIIQILLQLLLVLLVEIFQEQFKRTFQVYVLVFFRLWNDNLITPLLSIFFPRALFGPLLEALGVVLPSLYKVSFSVFQLLFLLFKPLFSLFYTILLGPLVQLLNLFITPICKYLFQNMLSRFSMPVGKFMAFLWKVLAPYLQQRELLKKLAYPFVASFAKIQVYLLPNWVLLRYEAFISHLVGKDSRQKDLDVALVLVFSFLVLIEVTVIIFGYIFKVILIGAIWWRSHIPFGAAWLPQYIEESIPPDEIVVWWPNLGHHESGAMVVMTLILVTTAVIVMLAALWILYYLLHFLFKKCLRLRKRKRN